MAQLVDVMGLAGWDIEVTLVPGKTLHNRYAENAHFALNKQATIRIGRREDFHDANFAIPSYEDTFLHELAHVLVAPMRVEGADVGAGEEIVVNDIVKALLRYKALP